MTSETFPSASGEERPQLEASPSPRVRPWKIATLSLLCVGGLLCLAAIGLIATDLYWWGWDPSNLAAILGAALGAVGAIAAVAFQAMSLNSERKTLSKVVLGISCVTSILVLVGAIYPVATGSVGYALTDACADPLSYDDYYYDSAPGEAYCRFGVGVILSWVAFGLFISSLVPTAVVLMSEGRRVRHTQSAQMPPPQGFTQVPPPQGFTQVPPPQGFAQMPPQPGFAQVPPPQGFTQVPPQPGFAQMPDIAQAPI